MEAIVALEPEREKIQQKEEQEMIHRVESN
jgi:hypothetical protein